MKRALFAGSFNPVTLGHLDIIERASPLFHTLIVGIAINLEKAAAPFFTLEETQEVLKHSTSHLRNVEVVSFAGLTVDYAKKHKIDVLIRSLRSMGDFEWELSLACANRKLSELETLFIAGNPQYAHISSKLIREIAAMGGSLEAFVPAIVEQKILEKKQ